MGTEKVYADLQAAVAEAVAAMTANWLGITAASKVALEMTEE